MTDKAPTRIDRRVGTHILFFRIQKGMTCTRLGEIVGVTPQQILNYENAHNRVPAGTLAVIADSLGLPMSIFFEDIGLDTLPLKTVRAIGYMLFQFEKMDPSIQQVFKEFVDAMAEEAGGADTPEGIEFTVGDMMAHFVIIDPL